MGDVSPHVTLTTSLGQITFELYTDDAPKACSNFVALCKAGYYNNTIFHRIIKGYIVQGGDPSGTGTGGTSSFGRLFGDECTTRLRHTGAGLLCMANAGRPMTNGSQFFVTLAPLPQLDSKSTIFGRVTAGMLVLKAISEVQVDESFRPFTDVRVVSSQVKELQRQRRPNVSN